MNYDKSDFESFMSVLSYTAKYFPILHKEGLERPIAAMTRRQFVVFKKMAPNMFISNDTQLKLETVDHNITIFDIQFYENPLDDMDEEEFKKWFKENGLGGINKL